MIADAKRGDIGTTMDAYARAWLAPGSPLEADAMTVSPFLGVGALTGAFGFARKNAKGVFVLAATSNPQARTLQAAQLNRPDDAEPRLQSVADRVAVEVAAENARGRDRRAARQASGS